MLSLKVDGLRLGALIGLVCAGTACGGRSSGSGPELRSTEGAPPGVAAPFGLQRFTFSAYPNMIAAAGSWIADSPGVIADTPIQTSDLSCFRDRNECVEARAFVNPGTKNLLVQTLFYQVKKWTEAEVVAELSLAPTAGAIQIRFDMRDRTVRMTESRLPAEGTKSRYEAHLDDGDKVDRRPQK